MEIPSGRDRIYVNCDSRECVQIQLQWWFIPLHFRGKTFLIETGIIAQCVDKDYKCSSQIKINTNNERVRLKKFNSCSKYSSVYIQLTFIYFFTISSRHGKIPRKSNPSEKLVYRHFTVFRSNDVLHETFGACLIQSEVMVGESGGVYRKENKQ